MNDNNAREVMRARIAEALAGPEFPQSAVVALKLMRARIAEASGGPAPEPVGLSAGLVERYAALIEDGMWRYAYDGEHYPCDVEDPQDDGFLRRYLRERHAEGKFTASMSCGAFRGGEEALYVHFIPSINHPWLLAIIPIGCTEAVWTVRTSVQRGCVARLPKP